MWANIKNILKKEYYIREIIILFIIALSMLGFGLYESLAIFAGTVEKNNVATITAGSINFSITSTNTSYNSTTKRITVSANSTVNLTLTVTNTTPITSKYRFYYKPISPTTLPSGSTVSILSTESTSYDTGTLNSDGSISKEISIKNSSTSSITIEIGVQGGYENNTVSLSSGNYSLSLQKIYKDNSGANTPKLASGMIPVVYDETSENWEVADTSSEWYNYDEQWWANAVTTSSSTYRTASPGTEIPMSSINSMWVWIPRYKYRIPSNIGSSSAVGTPPEIDVVFENGTNTTGSSLSSCSITSTSCYYTHPAFRDGSSVYKTTAYDQGGWDEELEGIWVGKFETGTEGDTCSSSPSTTNCQNVTPKIKPDIRSLRYQTVYNQFVTSLKFAGGTLSGSTVTFSGNSTYGLTSSTDTHMMKNTEWGAVAYLSQSEYGKKGNANYSGTNKEIYINNSSNTYGPYTGRSGEGPGGSTPVNGTYPNQTSTTQYSYYGFYTYNDYLLNYNTNTKGEKVAGKGVGASTTGTIYGIYDMSGGSYEYTMSNWAGTVGYSGFTTSTFPGGSNGSKYYDIYTGTSSSSITSAKSIKGDATYETMRWYSDGATFPYAGYPWSNRGGGYNTTSSAGAFRSNVNNGASNYIYGFRVVLIP